jgi:hypothetical protein
VGLHARTLIALCALLFTGSLAVAGDAHALTAKVRVELPNYPAGFVPRTQVTWDETQPVTIPADTSTVTCAGTSPMAALNALTSANPAAATTTTAAVNFTLATIKNITPPAAPSSWTWVTYVSQQYTANPCTATVPQNGEVLFYPWCNPGKKLTTCFTGGPLYLWFLGSDFYPIDPINMPLNTPAKVYGFEADQPPIVGGGARSPDSTLTTDGGFTTRTDSPHESGLGNVIFPTQGNHSITITEPGKVPDRAPVCVTNGGDGFCGTVFTAPPAFDANLYPSDCTTNGHDGACGTQDTSGPVVTITNIKQKQVFKKKKGPGRVLGSLAPDPNGVGKVQLRLMRTLKTRVAIKAKKSKSGKKAKKRYRTVTRCWAWDDGTALLETSKCTAKPKWAEATLDDTRQNFSYGFAMTLPRGSYKLEVQSQDVHGFPDDPTPGRNILTFTVS